MALKVETKAIDLVQVRFVVTDDETGDTFSGALNMTKDQYSLANPDDLEAEARQRFTNWKNHVSEKRVRTLEDVRADIEEFNARVAEFTAEAKRLEESEIER